MSTAARYKDFNISDVTLSDIGQMVTFNFTWKQVDELLAKEAIKGVDAGACAIIGFILHSVGLLIIPPGCSGVNLTLLRSDITSLINAATKAPPRRGEIQKYQHELS